MSSTPSPPLDSSQGSADAKPKKKRGHRKAVSCVSCRTKKIRCDRSWPCSGCRLRLEICEWTDGHPGEESTITRRDLANEINRLHNVVRTMGSQLSLDVKEIDRLLAQSLSSLLYMEPLEFQPTGSGIISANRSVTIPPERRVKNIDQDRTHADEPPNSGSDHDCPYPHHRSSCSESVSRRDRIPTALHPQNQVNHPRIGNKYDPYHSTSKLSPSSLSPSVSSTPSPPTATSNPELFESLAGAALASAIHHYQQNQVPPNPDRNSNSMLIWPETDHLDFQGILQQQRQRVDQNQHKQQQFPSASLSQNTNDADGVDLPPSPRTVFERALLMLRLRNEPGEDTSHG